MNNKLEYILCSAIKRKTPKPKTVLSNNDIHLIEIGYRHCDIRDRFPGEVDMSPSSQGFYTSKGRFVGREEARLIAINAGQIENTINLSSQLFSEDLY